MNTAGSCPRCDFALPALATECPRCGVVFAKLRWPDPAEPSPLPGAAASLGLPEVYDPSFHTPVPGTVEGEPLPGPAPLDAAGRRALLTGLVLAVPVLLIPFARFVLRYLGILVHELGHAAVSWLFGYPALPAFDFVYGGGFALSFSRSGGLLAVIVLLWAAAFWFYRRFPRLLVLLGGGFALWLLLAVTPLNEAAVLAAGHGSELLFAAVFLFRAATGYGCRIPEVERPLYALVGFFLVLEQTVFAWGLLTSAEQRELYADAKGGGHMMDFSRLALDYLHVSLETIAALFLVACLATPPLTWLWVRHRARWLAALERFLARR